VFIAGVPVDTVDWPATAALFDVVAGADVTVFNDGVFKVDVFEASGDFEAVAEPWSSVDNANRSGKIEFSADATRRSTGGTLLLPLSDAQKSQPEPRTTAAATSEVHDPAFVFRAALGCERVIALLSK
jgi:hypothetical protein